MEHSDQNFSALFKDFEIIHPSIFSKVCGHKLERMCTLQECDELSLYCQDNSCEKSYQKHCLCQSVALKGVTDVIKQYYSANKDFLGKLFEIEDALIYDITKKREEIIKKMSYGNLEEKYQKIIGEIYRKGNGEYIKGKEASEFFKKLILLSKTNKDNTEIHLQKFALTAKKAFTEFKKAQETILNQYLSSIKAVSTVEVKKIIVPAFGFNSVILMKEDPKYQEKIALIYDSLVKPRGLQLLFRASEHQFQAAKFHEKCNNIPQTFTLIRTEFGKTIAGYNLLRWNVPQKGYLADYEEKCFLLSIDLKQKMALIDQSQAIFNHQTHGPTFGGGHDIVIYNKCHENQNYSNFPYSYNFTSRPYVNNQASYTAFSGATNGKNFKVVEYEVYRVIR